jgi:MFS family permease
MTASPSPLKEPWYPWIGKRPFYGWIIVIIGAVTQFFQGIASLAFSAYLIPLQNQFGWSAAALAGPRSVTQVEGAITGPLEGFLVDRFGPRRVVAVGIFITGIGFILFGIMNSYWMYYLSSMVITLGIGLQGLLVMSVTVNNWFNRRRTIANSVMGLGYSMAGVIGVPAITFIILQSDWQMAAFVTAGFVWVVGFPFAMLLRVGPETVGSVPDGSLPDVSAAKQGYVVEAYDFTLKEAIRTRSFWLLAAGWSISNIGILGVQVHLFLHLENVGLPTAMVALVWSVASLSNIPSRLLGGFFGDRLPKNIMLGVSVILMAVAVYILAVTDSPALAFSYAVIFGIGWGIRTPIVNAIQGEYFGRKSQGIIRGWLQSLGLPIIIAAPVVAGYMWDIQGTYRHIFSIMAAIMLVGSVLIFFATRPAPPTDRGILTEN